MKRIRLLIAAVLLGLVTTTACSSDLLGPNPTPNHPSFDGQGGFGSGG